MSLILILWLHLLSYTIKLVQVLLPVLLLSLFFSSCYHLGDNMRMYMSYRYMQKSPSYTGVQNISRIAKTLILLLREFTIQNLSLKKRLLDSRISLKPNLSNNSNSIITNLLVMPIYSSIAGASSKSHFLITSSKVDNCLLIFSL